MNVIDKSKVDGIWYYNMCKIRDIFCKVVDSFSIDLLTEAYENQTCKKLSMQGDWMSLDSLLSFLKWYDNPKVSDIIHSITKAIKKDKKSRRAFSRSNRWDIAYSQKYTCGHCNMLLHPSFEVDHIKELCDGGLDILENCVALCRTCHGIKTRDSRKKRIIKKRKLLNERTDNTFGAFEYSSNRKSSTNKYPM